MFEYHMPDSIKDLITEGFATTFWDTLQRIFPDTAACLILDYDTGTVGWNDALKIACEECSIPELYAYADALEWHDWDIFAYELTELCLKIRGQ